MFTSCTLVRRKEAAGGDKTRKTNKLVTLNATDNFYLYLKLAMKGK